MLYTGEEMEGKCWVSQEIDKYDASDDEQTIIDGADGRGRWLGTGPNSVGGNDGRIETEQCKPE